ncbi:hypothetical protein [Halobaculum sp. MBLA0143]|uniref:hypothetical protein n=1 Tax=Halobaculum sp. MBLA0143 TaxID=3079933 RepID=UPI003523CA20
MSIRPPTPQTHSTRTRRATLAAAAWLRAGPLGTAVAWLRHPQYTGDDRCLPCTVVNLAAVAVGGTVLATVSPTAALVAVLAGVAAIWLRGYVVPYTPTLTRRYLPERVLAWFGKAAASDRVTARAADRDGLLEAAGLLRPTPVGDDVRLDAGFAAAWLSGTRVALAGTDGERTALSTALGVDRDALVVTTYDDGVVAHLDGVWLGTWESRAALFADTAAFDLLPEWLPEWDRLTPAARTETAASLRLFAEVCPACGGAVRLGTDTVPSCCSSRRVVAVSCVDCDTRMLEVRVAADSLE